MAAKKGKGKSVTEKKGPIASPTTMYAAMNTVTRHVTIKNHTTAWCRRTNPRLIGSPCPGKEHLLTMYSTRKPRCYLPQTRDNRDDRCSDVQPGRWIFFSSGHHSWSPLHHSQWCSNTIIQWCSDVVMWWCGDAVMQSYNALINRANPLDLKSYAGPKL